MRHIVFHPEAKGELAAAARWYERARRGLGKEFRHECRAAVARIGENPDGHVLLEVDIRCCRVRRFPYGLLFYSEQQRIVIIAVMHLHREPGYWRARMPAP